MNEPEEQLEDVIAHRLLSHAAREENSVKQDEEEAHLLGREGDMDEQLEDSSAPTEEGSKDIPDALPTTNFAKVEKSLASLGFFTPSSRRLRTGKVKKITFNREVDGKRIEVTAEIVPSAISGVPITADQDKYLALQEIITNILQTKGRVENPIRFKSADLIRLLKNNTDAGKNYKEIYEWLEVMTGTMIISKGVVWSAGQKRYVTDRFHVFDRSVSAGKELEDGSIADANYVWVSSWQLDNINHKYLVPIDLESYRELKNHIAKALVPLLQVWLFASQKAGSFEKRYEELCEILDVTKHRAPSLITRQLQPSLDELKQHGYLKDWLIETTNDKDKKAYKVILFHGPKFHRDRRKRIEQMNRTQKPVIIAQSQPQEPDVPELGKPEPIQEEPAAPATKKPATRNITVDQPATSVDTQKDVTSEAKPGVTIGNPSIEPEPSSPDATILDELVARGLMASATVSLLNSLSPEQLERVPDYIEYWDAQKAKSTKEIGEGLLYNLIKKGDPLPPTFISARAHEAQRIVGERRELLVQAKQSLDVAYEQYREDVLDRFIENEFPKDEYDRLYAAYKQNMTKGGGIFAQMQNSPTFHTMVRGAVKVEIRKRVHTMSFDEFCQREARNILTDYQIDPAELGITSIPSPQPEAISQGGEVDHQFSSHQHHADEIKPEHISDSKTD